MTPEPNVLRSIWSHRLLVILVAAVFAFMGALVYVARPVTYSASAGALLQDPLSQLGPQGGLSTKDVTGYVANQVAVMSSPPVLNLASSHMARIKGITALTPGELRRAMSIQPDQGSSYVTVHVSGDDPLTARMAADSVIYAYRVVTRNGVASKTKAALRRLDLTIAAVARTMAQPHRTAAQQATSLALIQQLRGQRNRIEVEGQIAGDGISLFSPASAGKRRGAPLFASVLIGLVIGALVGCGAAYLLDAVRARRFAPKGATSAIVATAGPPEPAAIDGAAVSSQMAAQPEDEPVARQARRWG